VEEFKYMAKLAKEAGLEVHFISPAEANKLWPGMEFDDALAILLCPTDGYLQPYDLTMTYKHHARKMGVKFQTSTSVTGIEVALAQDGIPEVKGVETDKGKIKCETVINSAGAHAYHIAKLVGLELPIVPVRHHYFITQPIMKPGVKLTPSFPTLRIVDRTLYARPDVNSILIGGWEEHAMSIHPSKFSLTQKAPPIVDDWGVFSLFAELLAASYYPITTEVGIRSTFNGWPTFTPDGKFIIGKTKKVRGFVMAAGCNAHGVSGSAGIGRHVVEALEKNPSKYVQSLSPDRFLDNPWNWTDAEAKARGIYETYYSLRKDISTPQLP